MGTTFVTLSSDPNTDAPGFWMSDGMLELWLRLLALHLPDPMDDGRYAAVRGIRDQWLLGSRGFFMGCVPHGLEEACGSTEGQALVRSAVLSLLAALGRSEVAIDPATLNL